MPEPIDVIESSAIAIVPILSSVRANRTAVPEMVATASESRNQLRRNIRVCRNPIAFKIVRQKERSEKEV